MNNKHIYDIDVCKADEVSQNLVCLLVDKLEKLDINTTTINRLYLKAGNNYFGS